MPKARLEVTTTTEVTTTVKLSPKAKRMILERIAEFELLDHEIGERATRQDAIKKEVDALFAKEGQGAALIDGASIDGNRAKWVFGTSTKLDEKELCATTGITPAQIDACKVTKEKKPYLKLTPKGKKDKEHNE